MAKDKGGYVYLLGDFDKEDTYKIGVTCGSIQNRIKKLQTGNSGEIYVVKYYHCQQPFFVEKWLHKHFLKENVKNEWFQINFEDIKKFESLCKKYDKLYNKYEELKNNMDVNYVKLS